MLQENRSGNQAVMGFAISSPFRWSIGLPISIPSSLRFAYPQLNYTSSPTCSRFRPLPTNPLTYAFALLPFFLLGAVARQNTECVPRVTL
ncbi:MAG TPA: hypothetical protein VEM40_00500 [Nitrospirota bacterium]|nr:hypothetical protein [Nitrospirota bacterium]